MVAVYVSSAATGVGTTVTTVPAVIPAGNVGDLMLACAWSNNSTATWTATGWAGGTMVQGTVPFWRIADGTEGATMNFVRATNATNPAGVTIARYRNAGPVHLMQATGQTSGTSTTIALTGVTTTIPGCDLIQIVAKVDASGAWSPPGTATERFEVNTSGGSGSPTAGGDEVVAAAGATGTRTWTRGATELGASRGVLIAVAPYRRPAQARSANPALGRSFNW